MPNNELPDMTTTGRHGFAIYKNDIMIAWVISHVIASDHFPGCEAQNVQNGYRFTL